MTPSVSVITAVVSTSRALLGFQASNTGCVAFAESETRAPIIESLATEIVLVSVACLIGTTGDGNNFCDTRMTIAASASATRSRFSMNYKGITARGRSHPYRMVGIEQVDE